VYRHHGDEKTEQRLPGQRAGGDIAAAHDEHGHEADAGHRLEHEAREVVRVGLPNDMVEQVVTDRIGTLEHARLAAVHLDHADAGRHLQEAVEQRGHGAALEARGLRDALAEEVHGHYADRDGHETDHRELWTQHPRDDCQPGEARQREQDDAEVERDYANALEIVVRRHHQIALTAAVEEAHGQREQLAKDVAHRVDLDAMRETHRDLFAEVRREDANGPQPEDHAGTADQQRRAAAVPFTEHHEDFAERPHDEALHRAL